MQEFADDLNILEKEIHYSLGNHDGQTKDFFEKDALNLMLILITIFSNCYGERSNI